MQPARSRMEHWKHMNITTLVVNGIAVIWLFLLPNCLYDTIRYYVVVVSRLMFLYWINAHVGSASNASSSKSTRERSNRRLRCILFGISWVLSALAFPVPASKCSPPFQHLQKRYMQTTSQSYQELNWLSCDVAVVKTNNTYVFVSVRSKYIEIKAEARVMNHSWAISKHRGLSLNLLGQLKLMEWPMMRSALLVYSEPFPEPSSSWPLQYEFGPVHLQS